MKIELVGYREELKDRFRLLNEEWLEAYFHVEPIDRELLSKPEETILAKGGCVYFALVDGDAIGTGSVIPVESGVFELGKMAVTPAFQGKGIGRLLVRYAIDWARGHSGSELNLYTSSKLIRAIELYRKVGFVDTELGSTPYGRADVRMSLDLSGGDEG